MRSATLLRREASGRGRSVLAALLTCAAALALPATPAAGQSDAELRAENQALRTRVRDLELELAAARSRIAELEQRLADAQARLSASGPMGTGEVPPPAEPEITIDESIPTASPRTLLKALQADYGQTMADAGGFSTPKERTLYFRALEKWIAASNRRYRAPIDWIARLEGVTPRPDGSAVMRLAAVDPGNGAQLGDPFDVMVPTSVMRRFEASRRGGSDEYVRLRGTLVPELRINDQRAEVGAFDQPRYIGPFAEFLFAVEARSVTALRADATP